jgi:hypothetical protein
VPPRRSRPTRYRGRAEGAVWRRIVQHVVSRDFGVCSICRHPGAKSADHVISVTERPDLDLAASNLKAAHGWPHPCETCSAAAVARGGKPVYCNEVKQAMSLERARRVIAERTGLPLDKDAPAERKASGERDW